MLARNRKYQWLPLCFAKFLRAMRIVGVVHPIKVKTKLACILEAGESTRLRMGESLPTHHEDHFAGKNNSLQHYNLVHKFIPMHQAMKIPAAKAAVDKEWGKLEKIPAWNLTKVRSKREVIDEARTKGEKVQLKGESPTAAEVVMDDALVQDDGIDLIVAELNRCWEVTQDQDKASKIDKALFRGT